MPLARYFIRMSLGQVSVCYQDGCIPLACYFVRMKSTMLRFRFTTLETLEAKHRHGMMMSNSHTSVPPNQSSLLPFTCILTLSVALLEGGN